MLPNQIPSAKDLNVFLQPHTRPGTNDEAILVEARGYFPHLIDYSKAKIVFDLGAHIGGFTRFVKEQAPDAIVMAVEADRENAAMYLTNVRDLDNVFLRNARCAYSWTDVVLLKDMKNTGGRSFVPREMAEQHWQEWSERFGVEWIEERQDPVQTITLEELFGCAYPQIDVLKLDIEGAEFDVLLNAPIETLCRFQWIVGEVHHLNGDFHLVEQRLKPWFQVVWPFWHDGPTDLFWCRRLDQ